jgi:ATP-dependent protease ClpP protease subunit
MSDQAAEPGVQPKTIPVPSQSPLFHSIQQARYSRQELLRTIERYTSTRVIAYVAAPGSSISSFDIPPFADLLHDIQKGDSLDLVLQTPGGDVDQAERIVMMCRKKIGEGVPFRVIVPDSAKSAGTLIALASDEIIMGFCSELGPIDPVITVTTANGENMTRPAQSFLDGLAEIVQSVGEASLSPAYFPLLDKLDPALIDFCKKAIQRSERFASEFLKKYMLANDHVKADEVARILNDSHAHLSHGAVIDAEKATSFGLNVQYLAPENDLWQAYWRLYCEMRLTWGGPTQRLYEGRQTSLLLD